MTGSKRPIGVLVYGILFIVASIISGMFVFWINDPHPPLWVWYFMGLPWALLITGIALIAMKEWGRRMALVLSGLGLIEYLYLVGRLELVRGWLPMHVPSQREAKWMIVMAVQLILIGSPLYYLTRSKVKVRFGVKR